MIPFLFHVHQRVCAYRKEFAPWEVDSIHQGRQNIFDEVAFLGNVFLLISGVFHIIFITFLCFRFSNIPIIDFPKSEMGRHILPQTEDTNWSCCCLGTQVLDYFLTKYCMPTYFTHVKLFGDCKFLRVSYFHCQIILKYFVDASAVLL